MDILQPTLGATVDEVRPQWHCCKKTIVIYLHIKLRNTISQVGEDGRTKTVVKLGETASQGGEEDGCYSLYTRSRFLWDTTEVIPTSSLSLNNDVAVDESQRRIVRLLDMKVFFIMLFQCRDCSCFFFFLLKKER